MRRRPTIFVFLLFSHHSRSAVRVYISSLLYCVYCVLLLCYNIIIILLRLWGNDLGPMSSNCTPAVAMVSEEWYIVKKPPLQHFFFSCCCCCFMPTIHRLLEWLRTARWPRIDIRRITEFAYEIGSIVLYNHKYFITRLVYKPLWNIIILHLRSNVFFVY